MYLCGSHPHFISTTQLMFGSDLLSTYYKPSFVLNPAGCGGGVGRGATGARGVYAEEASDMPSVWGLIL